MFFFRPMSIIVVVFLGFVLTVNASFILAQKVENLDKTNYVKLDLFFLR